MTIHNPDVQRVRPLENLLKLRVSRAPGTRQEGEPMNTQPNTQSPDYAQSSESGSGHQGFSQSF